jgi:hypothetical protein
LVGALDGLVVFRCRLDSGRMPGFYRRPVKHCFTKRAFEIIERVLV